MNGPLDGAGVIAIGDDAMNWPLRVRLALVAAWEIDALARMLRAIYDADDSSQDRATCGVLNRVLGLAETVMSALADESECPSTLRARLFPGQEADFAGVGERREAPRQRLPMKFGGEA